MEEKEAAKRMRRDGHGRDDGFFTGRPLIAALAKTAALIGGYAASLSAVRGLSRSFSYYMARYIGDFLRFGLTDSLIFFCVCFALYIFLVWKSDRPAAFRFMRRPDMMLLIVLAAVLFQACYSYVRYSGEAAALLLLPPLAYAAVMLSAAETARRIRDKRVGETLYWLRFFRLYPLTRPVGLLMALLLPGICLCYWFVRPAPFMQSVFTGEYAVAARPLSNVSLQFFFCFALSALTYFCAFVLSQSAEYDKANEEKIRAERFKSELIANVSHDIRTPLTAIISYVDLLKALPVDNPDFAAYTDILDKKAARLKTLIDDLMEASKAGTGNLSVELREIDLTEIVGQIAGEFDDQFGARDLSLVLRQPDAPVVVRADSRHLWRVLENLFANAAKYALPGTRVFAEIEQREGKPAFLLKNTSQAPIDMPGDVLTEQFIRGDLARHDEGSGLGLYIAKSLTELMGGCFTIRVSGDLFEVAAEFAEDR